MRPRGWAPRDGIKWPCTKRQSSPPGPRAHAPGKGYVKTRREGAVCEPGRVLLPGDEAACIFLGRPASRTVRNELLLFKPPSLGYSVMTAQAKTRSQRRRIKTLMRGLKGKAWGSSFMEVKGLDRFRKEEMVLQLCRERSKSEVSTGLYQFILGLKACVVVQVCIMGGSFRWDKLIKNHCKAYFLLDCAHSDHRQSFD